MKGGQMFASAEAEPGWKVAQTHVGQQTVAATTQTLLEVLAVAFETFASGEEQDANASDTTSRNIDAPFFF